MNTSRDPQRRLTDALAHLGKSSDSPDLTRPIMGRLGYMRVNPVVARRRTLAKWANRAGLMMIAAIALTIGWRVFETSPHVRRPAHMTLPQAISRDVQRQQERLGSMIQTIRSIAPPKLDRGVPATGNQGAREGDLPVLPESDWPQQLPDDVNRTSRAPVRWV